MAILNAVPGLEVAVQSFGQDLREYEDDGEWSQARYAHVPEGHRSQKFVECQTDVEFRIRLTVKHPFRLSSQSLTFRANVDGHGIAQAILNDVWFARCSGYYMELITAKLERISPTHLSSRALKFSSIKKVDDQDSTRVKNDAKAMKNIGEIVVAVFRTVQTEQHFVSPIDYDPITQHNPPAEVAEKALKGKAISHGVAYGEQRIVTRTGMKSHDLDGPNNPIGIFVFKYRSREDLQAELVIPRSPSPEQVSASRQAQSSSSRNMLVSKAARLASLKKQIQDIKAEEIEEPLRRKRPSDSEASGSGRSSKMSRGPSGKVIIDLTDD